MKSEPKDRNPKKPLMAQAVADIVGASLRQIQVWTDHGVIRCLPSTNRKGTGHRRIYKRSELPFAAFAAALAAHGVQIGDLILWSRVVRGELINPGEERLPIARKKYTKSRRLAQFRGEEESYIVLPWHKIHGHSSLTWVDEQGLLGAMALYGSAIVINVRETMSPFVER